MRKMRKFKQATPEQAYHIELDEWHSDIPTRIVNGPFGPHRAKKEFYLNGRWHFLKWMKK